MAKWDEITGDCRQEIVFIGQGIDLDILKRQLDACLLTPQEIIAISLELQDLKTTHDELDLYGRIMNYIHQHLTDPDLSIERIARVHYVSTRTVTRAFARYQKSPVAEIWKERLIASREAIERGQVRSISQAALDFGFSDFSHYSHAFRKAFGMAPHTLAPELSKVARNTAEPKPLSIPNAFLLGKLSVIPAVHHAHSLIEQTQAHQGKPGSGQLIPIGSIGGQRLEFFDGDFGHETDSPYFYPHKSVGS